MRALSIFSNCFCVFQIFELLTRWCIMRTILMGQTHSQKHLYFLYFCTKKQLNNNYFIHENTETFTAILFIHVDNEYWALSMQSLYMHVY